jgi:hypothetical protein
VGPRPQRGVRFRQLVGGGVVQARERPHLHARGPRVDVAGHAAAHVAGAGLDVPPDHRAVRGVVVVLTQPARIDLLHAITLQSRAVRVHLGDVEAVAVDDAAGAQRVTQGAVSVEHEPDLGDLVGAVTVDVDDARVVPVGSVLVAAQPLPLLGQRAAREPPRAHHQVEVPAADPVLHVRHQTRGGAVEVPHAEPDGHRAVGQVVGGHRRPVAERSGLAVEDRDELTRVVRVCPGCPVAEGDAVGDPDGDLRPAVAVEVVDRHTVPVPEVDRGRARFDVVLVGAVRPHVDRPQELPVASVGLDRLRGRLPVQHVVVLAVAVEVPDPDELHRTAGTQRNPDHRFGGMVGGQRERATRRLFHPADHRPHPVGVRLRQVGRRVDEVGSAGQNGGVEPDLRAPGCRPVHVEADAGRVEAEEPPADQHLRTARTHGHHAATQVLHRSRGQRGDVRPGGCDHRGDGKQNCQGNRDDTFHSILPMQG